MHLVAKEERCPIWAAVVPVLYVLACAAAARAVFRDPSADVGISGLLAAVGLVPAFAIPAVFATCTTKLGVNDDGLVIGSRACKVDDLRLEHAERGTGKLHVVLRGGQKRTFLVESHKEAARLVAMLPPASAPSGALAA
jgi:hypothetical protein